MIGIDKTFNGQIAPFQTNQWAVLKSNGQFSVKLVIITIYFFNYKFINVLLFGNNLFVRCWFKSRLQMQDGNHLRWSLQKSYGQNCPNLAESNGQFGKWMCRIAHCPYLSQSLPYYLFSSCPPFPLYFSNPTLHVGFTLIIGMDTFCDVRRNTAMIQSQNVCCMLAR